MDYKYIEQLIALYWEGNTTLEEEQILRSFFSSGNVPDSLKEYIPLFSYIKEGKEEQLGEDFSERMLSLIQDKEEIAKIVKLSTRLRNAFMPLIKSAAVVAVFVTLGNAAQEAFDKSNEPAVSLRPKVDINRGESVAMSDTLINDSMKVVPVRNYSPQY